METLRIIEHGNGHTDIEALIYGEWVVVKCILEDTMTPKIPTELAYARTAVNIAWDKYDAALGTPFQAELWKVVNWMEERASRIYRDWQAVGGTSDIDSITAAEIENDNKWLGMFETLPAMVDPRTDEQIALDIFQGETEATRNTDYPA